MNTVTNMFTVISLQLHIGIPTKVKDTKLTISHWNLPKKEEGDKNGEEDKETLKINVACLHLTLFLVNCHGNIVQPPNLTNLSSRNSSSFYYLSGLSEWLNTYRSQFPHL